MHFAENFNALYHIATISLQTAIEVVEVMNTAHCTCCGVEEFGRDSLGERVTLTTVHLVPTDQIVAFLGNHAIEFGYFVGTVLQVCIHGYDHIALCCLEAIVKSGTFSVITAELDAMNILVLFAQRFDDRP